MSFLKLSQKESNLLHPRGRSELYNPFYVYFYGVIGEDNHAAVNRIHACLVH